MTSRKQAGFTLVELVVVMTLAVFLSILVLSFALDFAGSTATLDTDSQTFVSRQNAGDKLRDKLNRASGLIIQNSIPDSHVHVTDVSTPSSPYWQILHAVPSTVVMPAASHYASVLYFAAPSVTNARTPIMSNTKPLSDEFVLYMDGTRKQLLLRTIVNPDASGNRLSSTCPPGQSSATCPADLIIADAVQSVSLRYFSRSGNLLDYTAIIDPLTGAYIGPDMPAVEVVELTITLAQKATVHGTTDTKNSTTIRVAFRNG